MRARSRFQVTARSRAITRTVSRKDPENSLDVIAETQAGLSVKTDGVKKVLCISGPGLWGEIAMTNSEAIRIGRKLVEQANMKNKATGEQVVFFPRKKAVVE